MLHSYVLGQHSGWLLPWQFSSKGNLRHVGNEMNHVLIDLPITRFFHVSPINISLPKIPQVRNLEGWMRRNPLELILCVKQKSAGTSLT
jgi:hypothetical protein